MRGVSMMSDGGKYYEEKLKWDRERGRYAILSKIVRR